MSPRCSRYDPSDTSNLFSHLTNASINKSSPDLLTDKEVIGAGCKWTMDRWFQHLESIGCNPYVVWEQIKDIAILTLLPIVADVPDNTRCFELFGFDVMLDQHWKPWIIEVNASPAIAISGMQDTTVKIVRRHTTPGDGSGAEAHGPDAAAAAADVPVCPSRSLRVSLS